MLPTLMYNPSSLPGGTEERHKNPQLLEYLISRYSFRPRTSRT